MSKYQWLALPSTKAFIVALSSKVGQSHHIETRRGRVEGALGHIGI